MIEVGIENICIMDDRLTDDEALARDNLFLLFNPALKIIIATNNLSEFRRYGYNSCRQSAVFASQFLTGFFPNYVISMYEGSFEEEILGQHVEYQHCFTILENLKEDKSILVDMSRTTKKLLFHVIDDKKTVYPQVEGYENLKLISYEAVDWAEMLLDNNCHEYFTGMRPLDLYSVVIQLVNESSKNNEGLEMNLISAYTNYTALLEPLYL